MKQRRGGLKKPADLVLAQRNMPATLQRSRKLSSAADQSTLYITMWSCITCPNDNQCGGSGMFIPDPGSWFLPIPDPWSKNSNKRERWKKINFHTFLCSHKFHKIVNYFSIEVLKKKIWANFQRIIELFTKKIVKKLLKIWSWDPGSGKNLFWIPDPGVKKAPDPGSGTLTITIYSSWKSGNLGVFFICLFTISSVMTS